jgi:hypothetical protein
MIISKQLGDPMKKRTRSTFSPEFRMEASQLVVDQNYTVCEAAKAMNVGVSTMAKWVAQLKQERECYNLIYLVPISYFTTPALRVP